MTGPLRILIVDDDAVDRMAVKRQLARTSLEIITHEINSAEECLKLLRMTEVDCILLDYRLPEMNGIDFLVRLRGDGIDKGHATVMMTGSGNERLVVQAMRLGVQDYLVKGEYSPQQLEEAILHAVETAEAEKAAASESKRLEEMALIDDITGIGNRNFFNMRLEHALTRARRQNDCICLLYMDLDRFKEVNDTLGHQAGDAVLREVAKRLAQTARDADTLARLGGDEFGLIMETGVTAAGAERLAARIKLALSDPIKIHGETAFIGVSIGIATFPEQADSFEALVRAADVSMYKAKFDKRDGWDSALQAGQR